MTIDEIQAWKENNLILGGSWCRRPDHEKLGKGADFDMIEQTIQKMKAVMIDRNITIDHLHDFLQSNVTSFDMPFHEFLRFDRSQDFIEDTIDQIIAEADFLPEVDNIMKFRVG